MNKQRAQEIAASPTMANVTYNGVPVYIQQVDDLEDTARVYPLDQPEKEENAPLRSLIEDSPLPATDDIQMSCSRNP
jgi:small acid-soluble spore protein H (minor)